MSDVQSSEGTRNCAPKILTEPSTAYATALVFEKPRSSRAGWRARAGWKTVGDFDPAQLVLYPEMKRGRERFGIVERAGYHVDPVGILAVPIGQRRSALATQAARDRR